MAAATIFYPASVVPNRFGMGRPALESPQNAAWDGDQTAFAPLVFREWNTLEGITEKLLVPARRELYSQDTQPDYVYIIETGLVKLVRLTDEGGESILGLRSDGWVMDAASAVLNCPHSSSAVTLTPCTIRRAHRNSFMQVLNSSPALTRDLNRLICREIHADQEQQIEFRNGTAQGRLERLVRELSRITRDPNPLDSLPLKKFEIAQLLSITPEHLSRLLRQREDCRMA